MGKRHRSLYGIGGRIIGGLLMLALLWQASIASAAAAQKDESKALYIVYDNSGSMAGANGATDAWCQAAYAIETLAALMDGDDRMYLYLMRSDSPYYQKYTFPQMGRTEGKDIREDVHEVLQRAGRICLS